MEKNRTLSDSYNEANFTIYTAMSRKILPRSVKIGIWTELVNKFTESL